MNVAILSLHKTGHTLLAPDLQIKEHLMPTQSEQLAEFGKKSPIFIECKLITTQFFIFTYVHLELPIIEAFENNFLVIFLTKKKILIKL